MADPNPQTGTYRQETDSMGTVRIPASAYYGPQTQRALENFPISGIPMPLSLIHNLALIKMCAAKINAQIGVISSEIADPIITAAKEVLDGRFDAEFPVDVFQTGSGTSTNMNVNEVIASRANEIITGIRGGKSPVHPNDHVNAGQSSNDAIPSAIHITAYRMLKQDLIPGLDHLARSLESKATEFAHVLKIGRTHLQDAVPLSLGQEFSGYARQIRLGIHRIENTFDQLKELALGGTAVGTGINAHPDFASRVIAAIGQETGMEFKEAENHFEAQASRDAVVQVSGSLKTIAVSLTKIANDIRWLASGPRCGIGEIRIPSLQPGSSIMPGKVNPVIPESVVQVAAQVMGNDTTIMICGQGGSFELNAMMPVMAYNLLQSIQLLATVSRVFADKCVQAITADEAKCRTFMEQSLAMVTYLIPHIGYDRAADIAKTAWASGETIRQVMIREKILPPHLIDEVFPVQSS